MEPERDRPAPASALPTSTGQERTQPGSDLRSLLPPVVTGLAALLIYGITMAPDLTWANFGGDGGDLISAASSWGIPHPPGYPTYVILGKLVSLIPAGSAAWRFNLFSAVCAAMAAAFVTAAAMGVLGETRHRETVSIAAGLTVAFAPLLWGQALISEVYALNTAVLAILLWFLLNGRSPHLSGFFLGLAVTTHLSSLIMLPAALALAERRQWKELLAGTLIGLVPLLFLPLLSRSNSPVVWGDPSTLSGWLWLISGRLYYANVRLPEMSAFLPKAATVGGTILRQFAWAGWLVAALGVATRLLNRRVTISLAAAALGYLIYGFLYQTDDAIVTLLPVMLLASPFLAAGLSKFGSWSLLLPVALLLLNFQTISLHNERSVRPLAEEMLLAAPQNAILLTAGDQSIFTLWYFHHVEAMRDDLTLVDANLLAFEWYRTRLGAQHPDLVSLEKDDLETFREENSRLRPVCDVPLGLAGAANCAPES